VTGEEQARAAVVRYWDSIALLYLELFRDEFHGKPFDRQLLASFAASLPPGAAVCDAGCGPCGHVTRLLADAGLDVTGVDISPRCIELARGQQPELRFETMDMAAMTFESGSLAGLVAYYSLHYLPRDKQSELLLQFRRVLAPGGLLLIAVKEGNSEGWIDDPMGTGQRVFWCDFPASELQLLVRESGFEVLDCTVRDSLPGEIAVRRVFLTARRVDAIMERK
jgi:SAM-dependent methyltransferase